MTAAMKHREAEVIGWPARVLFPPYFPIAVLKWRYPLAAVADPAGQFPISPFRSRHSKESCISVTTLVLPKRKQAVSR